MSVVRWGVDGSDVYIFEYDEGIWECCTCRTIDGKPFRGDKNTILNHLHEHRKDGETVPEWVIEYFSS
jgi:hypothetical protein